MKEQLNALIIDANGAGQKRVFIETFKSTFSLNKLLSQLPDNFKQYRFVNTILGSGYSNVSYMSDWKDAFCQNSALKIDTININDLNQFYKIKRSVKSYDLIIILHSAAGDNMSLLLKAIPWFQKRKAKIAMFIGNEYDLMEEKFKFIRLVGVEYICSQLPYETAKWLYADLAPSEVLHMPHALNPKVYFPSNNKRNIDIGFRGDLYPLWIGDTERNDFLNQFEPYPDVKKLNCNFVFNKKLAREEWAQFLNSSKGIIGGESGSYYLDRKGNIIAQAKAYCDKKHDVTIEELANLFFIKPSVPYISGKAISSRHFEPIGTKTCQILLEGDYNGILKPDEHYISVKKDLSNLTEAVEKFKDETYRTKIVEQAYQYVTTHHTYEQRVNALLNKLCSTSD